jgi:hypothetical protein
VPETTPQNYANHTRFDPKFHFFIIPVFVFTFLLSIWNLIKNFGFVSAWMVVVSLGAVVAVFTIRLYALKAQDRLIRLEERQRLSLLLPESLRTRIPALTEGQLIALRFASDAEIPALVEKTLAGNLRPREIKKAITNWRPDYFRI